MTERKQGSDMPDADTNATVEKVEIDDSSASEKGSKTDIAPETEDVLDRSDDGRSKSAVDTKRSGNA